MMHRAESSRRIAARKFGKKLFSGGFEKRSDLCVEGVMGVVVN